MCMLELSVTNFLCLEHIFHCIFFLLFEFYILQSLNYVLLNFNKILSGECEGVRDVFECVADLAKMFG